MPRRTASSSLSLVLAAGAVLGLTGCNNERAEAPAPAPAPAPVAAAPVSTSPDWVNDPTLGGKYPIAAYGVSEKMLSGEGMMRDRAMNAARAEIARSVKAKVQTVFKDWTREGGEITSQDNRQSAMTSAENVSRTVTDQVLSGTSQRARWLEPGTGKLYVWVYLDPTAMETMAADLKAKARDEVEKRAHFAAKVEADKAFADLDRLVDKEIAGTK